MRALGGILIIIGVVGFFYCSSHLEGLESIPEGTTISRYLEYDAGRYELGRYGAVIVGMVGGLLSVFPKGR